jgi:hypothetical protein
MKKHLIGSIVYAFLIGQTVFAQQFIIMVKPANSKNWGYANEKGDLIIPAQYSTCYPFSAEGLAVVKEKQYILINTKGEKLNTEVSDFNMKSIFGFGVDGYKDGLVMIKKGDKWGYLDSKGKLAILTKYDEANVFNDGFAAAKLGDGFVVLNTKGEEFKIAESGITEVKEFSEGMAPYRAKDKKYGFVSADGKIAIPAQFEAVGYFNEGLAWAKTDDQIGYIDTKGKWVIKPQFSQARPFDKESGLARVKLGDKWCYTNKTGAITYMDDTKVWGDFSEGLCDGEKNDKKGFYDKTGKWVIEPQFEGTRDFKNGYAAAKKGDKWGVIDKTGKWVIEPKFEGIKDMELVASK